MMKYILNSCILFLFAVNTFSQSFLHVEGKDIVDGDGENFIIRSIGTGNWMIQEGYMMQTAGVAGTQHEFRERLEALIGEERTDSFYMAWLENHFTRRDVDSLASWGFNSIRPALHYKWFTLPIEDEPVRNQQTWLETGFALTDSLVSWCKANDMYVIFDMHGAPGGQGANADISDYDPSKPSLWESEENKTKLVALWRRIAERYHNEPHVGGYDLINETNWTFPEGNNSQLRDIYLRITDTIREVDMNHILFIEGNWFANDFDDLTPPWDNNMVYSFHKYWTYNFENSLDWITWMRDQYNIPLWLGETGENSNTWFTNLIELAESKNIGWSWWPVKKVKVNNPLRVESNADYSRLVDYWKGQASAPSADEAYDAVIQFAENHHIENCIVQYDVLDAMFRQPHTDETKAFSGVKKPGDVLFASEYDLGKAGFAYFDFDTADYHGENQDFINWNQGYSFRNDGVDIESCSDSDTTNGYNVGWTKEGEWLVYSMHSDSAVLADGLIRTASTSSSVVVLEANGRVISGNIEIPSTGGWQQWRSTEFGEVLLPAGDFKLKVKIVKGGPNFSYIKFANLRSPSLQSFSLLHAETESVENCVSLHFNMDIEGEPLASDFVIISGSKSYPVDSFYVSTEKPYLLKLFPSEILPYSRVLELHYTGSSLGSGISTLETFTDFPVYNRLLEYSNLPDRIQAEDYYINQGFELEECKDDGGGLNTAYANSGDYLDYIVNIDEPQEYLLTLRVALGSGNASVKLLESSSGEFQSLGNLALGHTGGWQIWENEELNCFLPEGKYLFRILSNSGEFNLNWLEFSRVETVQSNDSYTSVLIFPNPVKECVNFIFPGETSVDSDYKAFVYCVNGVLKKTEVLERSNPILNVGDLLPGLYFLRLYSEEDYFQGNFQKY